MGVAGHLDDARRRRRRARVRQVQAVVTAEGVGLQVAPVVGEELLRAVALAVDRNIEHVVRVGGITQVDPEARRAQKMSYQLLQLDWLSSVWMTRDWSTTQTIRSHSGRSRSAQSLSQ